MEILSDIPFELDEVALRETCHIEADSDDAEEFGALVALARKVGRPKAAYRVCFIGSRPEAGVEIEGVMFTSRALQANLKGIERVFSYVCTCGTEMDANFSAKGDPLAEFWWDTIKMSLLRAAMEHLRAHIGKRYLLEKTASMAPGSADEEVWPIREQKPLFRLMGDVQAAIGVRLTDSCLMIPNKSVSGIRFPASHDFRSCQVCHREKCPSRQAAFDQALWDQLQHA